MKGKMYLARNIGLLTISQLGSKLLNFLLVPLYTSLLTTSEYGTYDLFSTTISLLIPILTLNVADSALRFTIDKNSDKKGILSICIKFFFISTILLGTMILIISRIGANNPLASYSLYFFYLFVVTSLNGITVNYVRGLDRIKVVVISGIICSVTMILLNILFLIIIDLGLRGYFLANILALSIQNLYLWLVTKSYKYISINTIDADLQKEMLDYSAPLIINNISWWISSVSDRYIVTFLCGIATNGIYSVGYKIPSIINVFQTIFNQAWTLSAVQDFDPDDKSGFFTDMYNSYNFCMTMIGSILIILTKFLARLLYAKEFYVAWQYAPFLMIATVFGALSGYIGAIFAAVKDSKIFARSSVVGALVNIIFNIALINSIGTIGAAIATAISYIVTWSIRIVTVKKYIKLRVRFTRDVIAYSILGIQSILFLICTETLLLYSIEIILIFSIILLFKHELGSAFKLVKGRRGKRNESTN